MRQFLLGFITMLSLPLMIFNIFAGIGGLVWLGWAGDWSTLGYALGAGVVAPFVLSFPLMLSLLFVLPAVWLLEKGVFGKLLSMPFLLLGGLVSWVVMAGWGLLVFHMALRLIEANHALGEGVGTSTVLPYLLAAYSVTTAPWSYMASKEGPDAHVGVPLFFTQISAAWVLFAIWLSVTSTINVLVVYLVVMGSGFLLSMVSGLVSMAPSKQQDAV